MKKLCLRCLLALISFNSLAQCNCQTGVLKVQNVALTTNLTSPEPLTNVPEGTIIYNTSANPQMGYYYWLDGWNFIATSTPLTINWTVVNSNFTGWKFGAMTTLNPTLMLYKGVTYHFNLTGNTGHPFRISTSNTLSPPSSNIAYGNGTTGQDAANSTLTFLVPYDAPQLYYLCTVHAAMRGAFTIF